MDTEQLKKQIVNSEMSDFSKELLLKLLPHVNDSEKVYNLIMSILDYEEEMLEIERDEYKQLEVILDEGQVEINKILDNLEIDTKAQISSLEQELVRLESELNTLSNQ